MRRAAASIGLALLLAACRGSQDVPRPNALEQLPAEIGLDVAAARGAVETFLEGYAHAARDDADALLSVTGDRRILRWVEWVHYQNQLFRGAIDGDVEVRALRFIDFITFEGGGLGAQVDADATVTFRTTSTDGGTETFSREFVGPFIVVRREPGVWAVVDATRDGLSMLRSVYIIRSVEQTTDGLSVRVNSIFTFGRTWQVNLVVNNRSGTPLSLRPHDATLASQEGDPVHGSSLAVGGSLSRIPPDLRIPGGVIFDPLPSARRLVLSLRFGGAPRPIVLEFPLAGAISLDPGPVEIPTGPAVPPSP